MIVVGLGTGTTTASTAIDLKTTLSTNGNLGVVNNAVQVLVPGIYEIIGDSTVTSTASGDTGLAVYVDGTISASSVFEATGASESNTVTLYDVIDVTHATSGYVTVTILPVNAPTIVDGSVSIKRLV